MKQAVTKPSFHEYSELVRTEIDQALLDYTDFSAGCPSRLREAIRHSLMAPGKRLRPLLVLMSAEACGCQRSQAMPAACAVEMIHTYSLIHDDLPAMDDDDMRRGQPSCHVAFGQATAILAGDGLLTYAFEVLAVHLQPPHLAARCCAQLASAAGVTAMVGGQQDDLEATAGAPTTEAQLLRIHDRKTGSMFRVSLRMGATVADACPETLDQLDTYGKKLGLAFQIIDDLLDVQGETQTLGKHAGKDVQQGKLTFPKLFGVDESRRRASELIQASIDAIDGLGEPARHLEALAQYVVERNR